MSRLIIGESQVIHDLIKMINKIASAKTNVLIIGESGTGKELIARTIHEAGPLKGKPFVPVNCGAIPETLMESELFGHRKGSFTGAIHEKPGLFEVANGGTLFLDEVGEIPLSMQVKLLRALQEKSIRKVGGTDDVRVDVRIIAATNRDLEAAVAKGTFREDLFYRLNVLLIKAPPLRNRAGDIAILAQYFVDKLNKKLGRKIESIEPEAMRALEKYPWPGNIRELENVIERAVTLSSGAINLQALPTAIQQAIGSTVRKDEGVKGKDTHLGNGIVLPAPNFSTAKFNLDAILNDVERTYLVAALEHAGGVKKKAAELLGITFRSIRYRLKKVGIEDQDNEDLKSSNKIRNRKLK